LGQLTRKNPSLYDLYCVGGTLSLTQSTAAIECTCLPLIKEYLFGSAATAAAAAASVIHEEAEIMEADC